MLFKNIHIKLFSLLLLLPLLLTACIDDPFCEADPENNGSEESQYLAFKMSLPVMSRDGASIPDDFEKYDNVIEKIQVLFFYANKPLIQDPDPQDPDTRQGEDEKGEESEGEGEGESPEEGENTPDITDGYDMFIRSFSVGQLFMIPIGADEQGNNQWYVRIPIKNEEDKKFADILRSNNFKIAVLANWESDVSLSAGSTVHDLHYVSDDGSMNKNVYTFLAKNGKMSQYTGWYNVKPTKADGSELKESEIEELNDWLRSIWNPALAKNPPLVAGPTTNKYQHEDKYGRYSDLWFLWNFGGADNIKSDYSSNNKNDDYADTESSNANKYVKWAGEWEKRNGKQLRDWITRNLQNEKEEEGDIDNFEGVVTDDERNSLSFVTIQGEKDDSKNAKAIRTITSSGQYEYGVKIPQVTYENPSKKYVYYNDDGHENTKGVFSFMARAVGTLYIKAKGIDGDGQIAVQIGQSSTKYLTFTKDNISKNNGSVGKIAITGDEQRVYIYNSGTTPVVIYEIEFIQGLNIYYTSREGTSHKIPMYGIQEYSALTNWEKGTAFDISNFNSVSENKGSDVYLLRSVAKVEINIPSSYNAHHVYLRSGNHSSRNEPMDVSTSTYDLWKDHTVESVSSQSDKFCEHYSLVGHYPFYGFSTSEYAKNYPSNSSLNDQFKSNLAWYYGTWGKTNQEGKLTLNGVEIPNKAHGKSWDNSQEADYPHILNPRIVRSDFIEFHYAGSSGGYDRFILYVGEKFIDDPNKIDENKYTLENEIPKVCHIEFRTNNQNGYVDPFYNLDDNNCYRVYFTKNGFADGATFPDFSDQDHTWENSYEQNPEILKKHWPIIRNHWYKFTVEEASSRYLSVDVNVLAWAKREIPVVW